MILYLVRTYPLETVAAFFLFSNAVGAMPKPTDCGTFQVWFYAPLYRFAHGLAGNILYAIRARFGKDVPDATC
jgi:hypothetical protein